MRFRLYFALAAALLLTVTACGQGESGRTIADAGASPARLVGPDTFAEAMQDPERLVINVHTPDEGSIPGTDLAIPFDQLMARADQLPADRGTGLAVYCMSGNMSETAVATLTDMGYLD
ncbi:MAG: rhodanese-like domain-containing protein [Actinomycetota bacterium]|nr:rhodanese-like domain-containing protein [Actinomycetota bacterium]